MSKTLQSLSTFAAVGLALAGAPLSSEARSISARSGSPHISSQGFCWAPDDSATGPTIINKQCDFEALWHIPLVVDGSGGFKPSVTVQGTGVNSVRCRAMSFTKQGFFKESTNFISPTAFGIPFDLNFSLQVPPEGTLMIDCFVAQNSMVHAVNW